MQILSVEQTNQYGTSEHMALRRIEDLVACGALRQFELAIEREELKRVVMIRPGPRAGPLITGLAHGVGALQSAGGRTFRRDILRELRGVTSNIEDEPVRDVGSRVAYVAVGIVHDEHKTHGPLRGIDPLQLRRDSRGDIARAAWRREGRRARVFLWDRRHIRDRRA